MLKKVGNSILGDLIYKTAGSQYKQSVSGVGVRHNNLHNSGDVHGAHE